MSIERRAPTRRKLLEAGWRGAMLAGLAGSGALELTAAGNRNAALICIFLSGGNDSANMFVPLGSYGAYSSIRGSLAIPQSQLIGVRTPQGAAYGFHPALSTLADQFTLGRLGVVANAGSDMAPNTHTPATLAFLKDGFVVPSWATSLVPAANVYRFSSGLSLFAPDWRANTGNALDAPSLLSHVPAGGAKTGLATELRQAAYLIKAGMNGNFGPQIYVATLSGFNTTTQQAVSQPALFAQLDSAIASFLRLASQLGIANSVVLYTDTEFGRTLKPNQTGGTDKGWGAHQFVLGNAVMGGNVYGAFPAMALGGPQDASGTGVWVPQTTREQMTAPLASWLGFGAAQVNSVLPLGAQTAMALTA